MIMYYIDVYVLYIGVLQSQVDGRHILPAREVRRHLWSFQTHQRGTVYIILYMSESRVVLYIQLCSV